MKWKASVLHTVTRVGFLCVILASIALADDKPSASSSKDKPGKPKRHEFTGAVSAIDAKTGVITIVHGKADSRTLTVTPQTQFATQNKPDAALSDIVTGKMATATFIADGDTLVLIKLKQVDSTASARTRDPFSWEEGTLDFRTCKVLSVSKGGLFVEMKSCFQTGMNIGCETRNVALVNHPKEKLLAEGDEFMCWSRREGSVEGKDQSGQLRRMPRWVYMSDR